MRGRIYQRPGQKHWTMVVDVGQDRKTGKRKQLKKTFNRKRQAQRELAKVLGELQQGAYIKPAQITVTDYLHQWVRDYVSHSVRPVTARSYSHWIERHIIPDIGNVRLSQLDASDIQALYGKLLKDGRRDGKGAMSARSVLHIHRLLHNALSHAVKWGIIGRNICDAVDSPRAKQKQMTALEPEDVNRLLEASGGTIYHPLFHLAVFTGMRRSELLGLRWRDVDLDMATVSISQVLHNWGKGKVMVDEPKTEKSRRQIALSPVAVIALRQHKEQQQAERLMLDSKLSDDDLVFANPDGKPFMGASVTHAFNRTMCQLGLKGVRFHDLRHTHASLMLRQGVNIKTLQERLGHSSISTTLDIYAHVTPGMQKEAALHFEKLLEENFRDHSVTTASHNVKNSV